MLSNPSGYSMMGGLVTSSLLKPYRVSLIPDKFFVTILTDFFFFISSYRFNVDVWLSTVTFFGGFLCSSLSDKLSLSEISSNFGFGVSSNFSACICFVLLDTLLLSLENYFENFFLSFGETIPASILS